MRLPNGELDQGNAALAAVMRGQGIGYHERKDSENKKKRSEKKRIHPALRMENREFHEERQKYGE